MSEYYETTDSVGTSLTVDKSHMVRSAVFIKARGTHVKADDLPELVAALYRAAGQEPPQTVHPAHRHIDSDGDSLDISVASCYGNTAYVHSSGAYVTAKALPALVEALYKATGQQAPLMVRRPAWWSGNPAREYLGHGLTITRHDDRIEVYSSTAHEPLDADAALTVAGVIASMGQAAAEAPPAEAVKNLTNLLDETRWDSSEDLARALLRAGYTIPAEVAE